MNRGTTRISWTGRPRDLPNKLRLAFQLIKALKPEQNFFLVISRQEIILVWAPAEATLPLFQEPTVQHQLSLAPAYNANQTGQLGNGPASWRLQISNLRPATLTIIADRLLDDEQRKTLLEQAYALGQERADPYRFFVVLNRSSWVDQTQPHAYIVLPPQDIARVDTRCAPSHIAEERQLRLQL